MVAMDVIEIRSLADLAFDRLVEAITRGHLEPGERLSEANLARTLGISRGPLREAIRRLEGRKLVVRTPNVGARVATLSDHDLLEIFLIREQLEGLAARLATERMSDAEIADLEAQLDDHARTRELKRGTGYFQEPGDQDFHFRIVRASRSEKLAQILCDDLYYLLRIFRFRSSVKAGRAQAALREHRDIVAAIRARDPRRAEDMMRRHISNARDGLAVQLAAAGSPA